MMGSVFGLGSRSRLAATALRTVAICLTACFIAAGCTVEEDPAATTVRPLKILMPEESFQQGYRDYFDTVFPGLEVETVWTELTIEELYRLPDPEAELLKIVDLHQPDLVITTDPDLYRRLADEELLVELTDWLQDAGLQEGDYHPGMLAQMRHNEQGGLYGFSPAFNATVLYYNKDLFRQFGIELPHDGMTWQEIMRLAQRFQTGTASQDGIVGFHQMYAEDPLGLIMTMARTEGLALIDPEAGKVTVDTPSWRSLFQTVIEAYQNGAFLTQAPAGSVNDEGVRVIGREDQANADLFRQGKSAMQIGHYPAYEDAPFEWGAVSPPVSEADRTRSADLYFYPIIGVFEGGGWSDQGLEVLRYYASEQLAKAKVRLMGIEYSQGMLSTHRVILDMKQDPILAGIYKQLPVLLPARNYGMIDRSFYEDMDKIIAREIDRVLTGEATVEKAMTVMQVESQLKLDQAIAQ